MIPLLPVPLLPLLVLLLLVLPLLVVLLLVLVGATGTAVSFSLSLSSPTGVVRHAIIRHYYHYLVVLLALLTLVLLVLVVVVVVLVLVSAGSRLVATAVSLVAYWDLRTRYYH